MMFRADSSANRSITLISRGGPMFMVLIAALALLLLHGCGLRGPQTGSLRGRVFSSTGDVVSGATVYSIFRDHDFYFTADDGYFYLPELPAGRNTIVVMHADYGVEQRTVEIRTNKMTDLEFIKLDAKNQGARISNVTVESTASTSAVISWRTYKPVACVIEYGTSRDYGMTYEELYPVSEHRITLTGLESERLYHFRITYVDSDSIKYFSFDHSFMTQKGYAPSSPTFVRTAPLSKYGVIDIEWGQATSPSVVGYRVSRKTGNEDWKLITSADLDRDSRSFSDISTEGGNFYAYSVRAIADDGALSAPTYSERVFMPGFISRHLTLTASDSPVLLYSDLIVGVGASVEVSEGVELRISKTDAFKLGNNPEKVEILVHGRLKLQGTSELPVRFTALDGTGSRSHWAGITIRDGRSGVSEISHIQISGCDDYAISVYGVPARIENISVRHSVGGVFVSGMINAPTLQNSVFEEIASSAITIHESRRYQIKDCIIRNSWVGITSLGGTIESLITIRETEIHAIAKGISGAFKQSVIANCLIVVPQGIGIEYVKAETPFLNHLDHCTIDAKIGVLIASGVPVIENNIIVALSGSGLYGIQSLVAGVPQFAYNNLYGFSRAYQDTQAGEGAQQFKPDFVAGRPYDYRLLPTSPLKIRDRNGFEMGRYGPSYR